MKKDTINFLETITYFGHDVLVPIKDIQYVMLRSLSEGEFEICIKGSNGFDWTESFKKSEEKKCYQRFKMIKDIIGAK